MGLSIHLCGFGSYFTHVQTCDTLGVQSTTQWTANMFSLSIISSFLCFFRSRCFFVCLVSSFLSFLASFISSFPHFFVSSFLISFISLFLPLIASSFLRFLVSSFPRFFVSSFLRCLVSSLPRFFVASFFLVSLFLSFFVSSFLRFLGWRGRCPAFLHGFGILFFDPKYIYIYLEFRCTFFFAFLLWGLYFSFFVKKKGQANKKGAAKLKAWF